MTHLYSIEPGVNPRDGVVEFINVGVDDKMYCASRHSIIRIHVFIAYALLVPFISTLTDVGPVVRALLANPTEWLDDEISRVSEALTPAEVAAAYSKVHGILTRQIIVNSIPAMEAMP